MRTLIVDTETYYDSEYSLSKMQTDAYIMDPRFEIITMCVMDSETMETRFHDIDVNDPASIAAFANAYPWGECWVGAHHTHFDGFIFTRRLGIRPKRWLDSLSLGRMFMPWLKSHSLAAMAKALGLPEKGTEVLNAIGKSRAWFLANPTELSKYQAYCKHDSVLCKRIIDRFLHRAPPLELVLIDMTIRMFTEPRLLGDEALMESLHADELVRKQTLLTEAGLTREIIMSNQKFADALAAAGVVPPLKLSKTTGRQTFAFAKSDRAFTDLLEHPVPLVQAMVAARLGVKTTIAETRAMRYLQTARRGLMPVYLNFWGAKVTGRYSGGNQMNWQNIPARGPSAGLRRAITAPPGFVVMAGDSSNIELRMVMAVAGQWDVLDKLRAGVDLYCDFASDLFGRPITRANKAERQLGKIAMLSLQYGAGPDRFMDMVRQEVLKDPTSGLKPITPQESERIVNLYRAKHHRVVQLWRYCQDTVLPDIANGCTMVPVDVNGWCITLNGGFSRGGEPGVVYKDLAFDPSTNEWTYDMAGVPTKIYGAKVVENLCQHLARHVVMWQTARINSREPVALSVHDEAVCVPEISRIAVVEAWMKECLSLAPPWCRDVLPVACEVHHGRTYEDCKG